MEELTKQQQRRENSNNKIKSMGIACYENLPMIETSDEVNLRSLDDICKRAIACLLSTQIACDIAEKANYEESKELFSKLIKSYQVDGNLLDKEAKLFNGEYTEQDAIDVTWTYETFWALAWALNLVEDIEIPNSLCDCEKAIKLVGDADSYEDFKNKCNLRDIEEILDMLDLYYRYHWATTEKRINPDTEIKDLIPGVVIERRRGLEWLISTIDDWNDIALHT